MTSIDLETRRSAIRARSRGKAAFEEFLSSFDAETRGELVLAATPGVAFRVDEPVFVTSNFTEEIAPEEPKDQNSDDGEMIGGDSNWDYHKKWILEGPYKLPPKAVASIGDVTDNIIQIIDASNDSRQYGLVMGFVQSGKTANYTSLLSRAVDMDYSIVIVLSGVLNDLRHQTQVRLMRDLIGNYHGWIEGETQCIEDRGPAEWELLTSLEGDINGFVSEKLPELLDSHESSGATLLGVVKKNTTVLEHLLNGILQADPEKLSKHRILVIDDEADHATVNTKGTGDYEDPEFDIPDDEDDPIDNETDPSLTNKLVRQIINRFERSTYVGYTATPYANVLIHNSEIEDSSLGPTLYPRDFIICLPRPEGYFGAETFFGDLDDPDEGQRFTTTVPEEQVALAFGMQEDIEKSREEAVPESLRIAMMDFLLTGIVKHIRRKSGVNLNKHHTMLIHIQWRNDDQEIAANLVGELWDEWLELAESTIGSEGASFRNLLKKRWYDEFRSWDDTCETWTQIEEELLIPSEEGGWMSKVEIRVINSNNPKQTLDYSGSPEGLNVIAIGGNKLSRGLTLEGLTVSFFLRRARSYDSLMQMGRWFGYRQGYEDLVRVHSSLELLSWFEWLVRVEESVRSDIARYEILGKSPSELAVRIPLHPYMRVTSANKMKDHIRIMASYQGTTAQSIRLPIGNKEKLLHNLRMTTDFLSSLGKGGRASRRAVVWDGARVQSVADFIESLDIIGPPEAVFDSKNIAKYLRKEHSGEEVLVVHAGSQLSKLKQAPNKNPIHSPEWDFGARYIARSQGFETVMGERRGTENLKVISDKKDVTLAVSRHDGVCLLVYLIAPGSIPQNDKRLGLPDLGVPIVGVCLRFPASDVENGIMPAAYAQVRGIPSDFE